MRSEVVSLAQGQQLPDSWHACVLLGDTGPTAQNSAARSWRTELVELLQQRWAGDGRLVVLLEEPATLVTNVGAGRRGSDGWTQDAAEVADLAAYWWPDDTNDRTMTATLAAWSGRRPVVYGGSPDVLQAPEVLRNPDRQPVSIAPSIIEMVTAILDLIGPGARRVGGERNVPLSVWKTESFQRWYRAQTAAGNRLLSAKLVWTFSVGDESLTPLYWALHVRIHIASEDRVKANEVVISRPDISVLALYRPRPRIEDTTVVLIREFRSPASTPDALVHELPGGSGAEGSALDQAISEAEEELGLVIDAGRVRAYGSRQPAATVSAHQAHLFAAEISDDELSLLRELQSTPQGSARDTERTWIEITTFREILESRSVDWATLGMISEILLAQHSDSAI